MQQIGFARIITQSQKTVQTAIVKSIDQHVHSVFARLQFVCVVISNMTTRIVTYEIEYCNSVCPHFYHNYGDGENIWCDKLKKKVIDVEDEPFLIWGDCKPRPIPDDCPLPKGE